MRKWLTVRVLNSDVSIFFRGKRDNLVQKEMKKGPGYG